MVAAGGLQPQIHTNGVLGDGVSQTADEGPGTGVCWTTEWNMGAGVGQAADWTLGRTEVTPQNTGLGSTRQLDSHTEQDTGRSVR